MPKADEVLSRLKEVQNEESRVQRSRCPHCKYRWVPKRTDKPKWCPRCHRLLVTEPKDRLHERRKMPNLSEMNRFTPANMKELVAKRLYGYRGIPKSLPPLTLGRTRQRAANLKLADRFFRSELNASDFARAIEFSRQAFWHRLEKGFIVMLERGCFVLTQKGRENIARSKGKSGKEAGTED